MAPEQELCLPLVETEIDPKMWATQRKVGRAVRATPSQIYLGDSIPFPHQKQYPLKPAARKALKAMIVNLKAQGLVNLVIAHITHLFSVSEILTENGDLFKTID